ncbi:hypothetical protein AWZ03_008776 [Drosophila navojoa]|uniref:MD-2-related lipid-recognition domain-containing protein n=1 Tax=Drosophila navojoa TaxID=7232 RepID=A0A484B941_DRONA|nr:uncharacterized protein LOC108659583 [Drosophila navojoa]TDG44802.1 hypothetical protein AWZ03_008776 [Drosophila navojoa]
MSVYLVQLFALLLLGSGVPVQGGEHNSTIGEISKTHEDTTMFVADLRVKYQEENTSAVFNGELKMLTSLDNDWKVNITILKADSPSSEYKVHKDYPVMGVCDLMGSLYKNFIYDKIKDYSNAPDPKNCPLSPQDFHIKEYTLHASKLEKYLSTGFYIVDAQLLNNDEIKLGYQMEIVIA